MNQPEPGPELDSNIANVVYKDAITEFEKEISGDDENANENLEERQIRYKNKFESLIKEHDSKRLKLNESEDNDKMSESNENNENTNIEPKVSDHLILSRYVLSNIVANIVSNIHMYVMQHVRT